MEEQILKKKPPSKKIRREDIPKTDYILGFFNGAYNTMILFCVFPAAAVHINNVLSIELRNAVSVIIRIYFQKEIILFHS